LFALAPDGAIHRIDEHPMSRHPVTPMREADLRRHLAAQTMTPVGLVSEDQLASCALADAALQHEIAAGHRAILFDTADTASLRTIGDLLWQKAASAPLFAIGSSGLTTSMIGAWQTAGLLETVQPPPAVAKVSPLLVISGSCSLATARQIEWAVANGFHGIALEPEKLTQASSRAYLEQIAQSAIAALSAGLDTVLYTAVGMPTQNVGGEALGRSLGELLRGILAATAVQRGVICGGDTSSHAVQQLEVFAMTWRGSIQPGAPVCLTHALSSNAPQFELILKGGQVGSDDFFARARG
jgi:uncharacterized protein YgbK (DUF1537 family)